MYIINKYDNIININKKKMLSKVVNSFVIRTQASKRFAPMLIARSNPTFYMTPQRFFLDRLGLESQSNELALDIKGGEVSLWKDLQKQQETSLVLKDKDQIEKYVISIVRNYFRTTMKAKVTLDSNLREHGLDSLDLIELVIQIEDELGYVIDAENLQKFQKPKHFVNFITQLEAYKSEFHRLPTDGVHAEFKFRDAFPGLPGEKKQKGAH